MKLNARTRFEKKSIGGLGGESPPTRTSRESREKKFYFLLSQKSMFFFQKERHANHK